MIWKYIVAKHIQRAHKRYEKDRPKLKEVNAFINNISFKYPFLRYSSDNEIAKYIRVKVSPFDGLSRRPMGAVPITRNYILLNAEWITKIFYYSIQGTSSVSSKEYLEMIQGEEELQFTLGHEMGHIMFDHGNNNLLLPRKRKRLINWTNEVFADYFSLYHVFKNDKDKVERILKRKSKTRRKDKNSNYHPSYELRVKYIGLFDFGEELIEEIARDCGCNEAFMIEKVKAWYGVSTKAVF